MGSHPFGFRIAQAIGISGAAWLAGILPPPPPPLVNNTSWNNYI